MTANVTRIMLAVNKSTIGDYPHASISSRGAFEWTIQKMIRPNVSSFEILLLHVPSFQAFCSEDFDKIYTSPECFETMPLRNWTRGLHLLEYFVTRCNQIGVACQAWIKQGDPMTTICGEANRIQPDLLVLGCRALSPAYLNIVRSVSEYCLMHAECPVVNQMKLHQTLCVTEFVSKAVAFLNLFQTLTPESILAT